MADANYNLGINISVGSVGVSSTLNAIEERFEKFSKSVRASSQSMNASMKGSMSTIDAEMSKFDDLNTKMQQVSSGKDEVSNKAQKMEQTTKKEKKALDDLGKSTKNHTKSLKDNNSATENWLSSHSRSIAIAIRSTAVWGLATTAIYGSQRAMREMHQTMMEVNSEMIALRRVMNEATTNFDDLRNTATDLGVEFAANVQDVVSSMVEWGRQGRSQVEVIELTEAALLATNVAQMDASQSVDLLTSALLQFNMEASESVAIIDRWNEVANNYAINATDIAMSIRESGAAARSAGISMDELIGMTTALSAATAKTGNRIGRSLRTIFSRMMGDMGDLGESVGKVEVALNSVGVSLRSSQNEYRNMTDVITDLAVTWGDLDDVMQANIARAIGGRRRYSDVIALIENWDMALDATQTSMGSLNSALEENETYMQGVEAQWTQVGSAFNRIINTLTEGGFDSWSIAVANLLENLFNNINNIIKGVQQFSNALSSISVGLLGGAGLIYAMNTLNVSLASTGTLLGTTMTASTALTTAFSGLLSAINPLYIAIGAATVTFTSFIKNAGELRTSIEEAKKAKEEFVKVSEQVDAMTKTEIDNSKELISQYSEMASKTDKMLKNSQLLTTNDLGSYFVNLGKGILPIIEDDMDKAIDNIETLATIFPELYKEGLTNTQFLELVQERLKTMNSYLENSVQWIIEDTDSMYENTVQGMRNAKMLQEKSDRYSELANKSDLTIEQEQEMIKIQEDLRKEFYELADSEKSFGQALEELVSKQMSKFGDAGTDINNTIDKLSESIDELETKEQKLETAYKKQGDRLETLNNQYQELLLSENSTAKQINDTEIALEKARDKYNSIGEALELTRDKQLEYINNLEVLQGGLDDIDAGQFLSNFEGLIGILDDFTEKVKETNAELMDIGYEMENELDFENWLGQVLDRSPVEQIEAEIGVIESYFSDVEGMVREISTLDPRDFETGQQLKDYIEEEFNVPADKLDLDVMDVYEAWDEGAFEDAQSFGKFLAEDFYNSYLSTLEGKQEDLSISEMFTEVMDVEGLFDRQENLDLNEMFNFSDKQLNNISSIFEEIKGDENTLFNIFGETAVSNFTKIGQQAQKIIRLRDGLEGVNNQISIMGELTSSNEVRQGLLDLENDDLDEYEQQLLEVTNQLAKLDEWEEKTHDLDLKDRIKAIRKELEIEKQVLKSINEGGLPDIVSNFNDFDISEITSMEQAENEINRLNSGLTDFKDTLKSLGVSEDNLEDTLKMLGLDEETIEKVFEELEGKINNLEQAWYTSMSSAISNAIEKFTSDMDIGDKLGIIVREGFSSAFANLPEDEIRDKLSDVGAGIGEMLNLGEGFGDAFGQFATQAGKVFGQGGSVGQAIATGLGTVLTGSSTIGSAIGSLGQMIFGGVEGRDEMEKAKQINEQVKEVQTSLEDFGIFYDAQLASFEDTAGFFQGLFGGEDWNVNGIKQAEMSLEDMGEILQRVGSTAQDIFGSLPGLLSQGLNYTDFRNSFEDTIGQAMQDAIIQKLLETQAIESQIQKLAGMVEMAVGDAGQINYAMLEEAQQFADGIIERASYLNEVVQGLDLSGSGVEADVTMDRTFRAGSTSAITYNNTFAVQSQIFLDDTAAAREAAKKLAPYIKDYLNRHS